MARRRNTRRNQQMSLAERAVRIAVDAIASQHSRGDQLNFVMEWAAQQVQQDLNQEKRLGVRRGANLDRTEAQEIAAMILLEYAEKLHRKELERAFGDDYFDDEDDDYDDEYDEEDEEDIVNVQAALSRRSMTEQEKEQNRRDMMEKMKRMMKR